MSNKIILKKSSVAEKAPVVTDLEYGELAINYTDGKLYFKSADNNIKSFTSNSVLTVDGNSGAITSAQLLTAIKKEDGTGSGLDADLLDGYHASATNTNNSVVVRSATGQIVSSGLSTQPQILSITSPTTNLDLSLADHWHLTLQSNTTFTLSNVESKIGSSGNIILIQDSVGGRTFTKSSEMKTPIGGATIVQTTTANSVSVLSYYVVSASFVIVNYIGNFA